MRGRREERGERRKREGRSTITSTCTYKPVDNFLVWGCFNEFTW